MTPQPQARPCRPAGNGFKKGPGIGASRLINHRTALDIPSSSLLYAHQRAAVGGLYDEEKVITAAADWLETHLSNIRKD